MKELFQEIDVPNIIWRSDNLTGQRVLIINKRLSKDFIS